MSSYTRFDLEQQIFNCWNVKEDLDTLTEAILDGPRPMTDDEISNCLIGMSALYDLKFQKLQSIFEALVHEGYSNESFPWPVPKEFEETPENKSSDR